MQPSNNVKKLIVTFALALATSILTSIIQFSKSGEPLPNQQLNAGVFENQSQPLMKQNTFQ